MNYDEVLRANGWKLRHVNGDPRWEHADYPLQSWSPESATSDVARRTTEEVAALTAQLQGAEALFNEHHAGWTKRCDALTATLDKVRALDLDPERLRLDKRIPLETKRALAHIVEALSTAEAADAAPDRYARERELLAREKALLDQVTAYQVRDAAGGLDAQVTALTTTLEKVRALRDSLALQTGKMLSLDAVYHELHGALATAGAPDAGEPEIPTEEYAPSMVRDMNESLTTPPEPKGPERDPSLVKLEAQMRRDRDAQRVKGYLPVDPDYAKLFAQIGHVQRDLAAANARVAKLLGHVQAAYARIAGLEDKYEQASSYTVLVQAERDAANARAEAAERAERDAVAALDANWVQHQRIVKAETERDQLAARVRELELALTAARIVRDAYAESKP